jgi:hypothetical protein
MLQFGPVSIDDLTISGQIEATPPRHVLVVLTTHRRASVRAPDGVPFDRIVLCEDNLGMVAESRALEVTEWGSIGRTGRVTCVFECQTPVKIDTIKVYWGDESVTLSRAPGS